MNVIQEADNQSSAQPVLAESVRQDVKWLTAEIQGLYCLDEVPWVVGYSGGKDSTAALQLVWNAIAALPKKKRTKPIHIISTDTLVENPIISAWVRQSLERMETSAQAKNLPFQPHPLKPSLEDTFWVNLLGKGYPAPRNKFRWCTARLKINPANRFVRDIVRANGETILILGTRKAESQKRASTMAKHAQGRIRDRLSPNASLPNSLIYTPIEDWSNDQVWLYLMQWENPWGYSNKELFQIYRGASADNECPLVIDTSTPSCGSSRFGCWVCTLVDRDKSMEAMLLNDESKEWMQALLDFRDELDFHTNEKLEQERQNRDFRRITGNVQLFERNVEGSKEKEVTNVPGPYIKAYRDELLIKLLKTQQEVRQKAPPEMQAIELISLEELSEIRRIWLEEKHEFDDSLPRIYHEVTGEFFLDPRLNAGNAYLGVDEWSILTELCEDSMHLELMNRLLDTERQFQTMSRRVGLYEKLDKCCEINFDSKDEALLNAHRTRNLKQAATQGDVDTIRQLTTDKAKPSNPTNAIAGAAAKQIAQPNSWAALKFGKADSSSLHASEAKADYSRLENAIADTAAKPIAPQPQTEKDYRPNGIPHIILTELVLQNFGPYQGQHTINLTSPNNNQPIILFGGMNGGGKTTLMDAIRLALYGQRALCSTRGKLSYSDFLKECVNRQTDNEPTSIELTFQQTLNNAPEPTKFRIHRTWNRQPKNGRDTLNIFKDDSPDAALTNAWDERIEDLLPLGISNLFLFDGEQVKELAEQDELPPIVVSAMRSLLGLELPDRLSTDLDVLIARKRKASAKRQDLQKLEEIEHRLESLTQEKRTAKQKLAAIQPRLEAAQNKLNQAEEAFLTQGGKIAAEQSNLETKVQRLQEEVESDRQTLRDLAAGILPLAMIQPLLQQAQSQATQEVQHQQKEAARDQIQTHDQRLLDFLPSLKLKVTQLKQIQAFLAAEQQALTQSQIDVWLGASANHVHQLASLLEHGLPSQYFSDLTPLTPLPYKGRGELDSPLLAGEGQGERLTEKSWLSNPIQQAQERIQHLQNCQAEIDATERYLATAAAPEVYEKLKHQFQQAQTEVIHLSTDHQQAHRELEEIKKAIARVKQELVDYSTVAIEQQTTEHTLKAAAKAQETLKEFKKRLKLRKLNQLETLVTECFLYLLHKSNLVHRIQINTETFCLSLFDYEGQPVPKHRLSAGEKQLLAISLLWGLARASGRQLPVAIDTPLGRLDSTHRNNLVDRYFPQASHQVILLSTDTEIREEEVKRLRDNNAIAQQYLLEYNTEQHHTQVKPGYFW
ncbi:DNA phosphorothioation system sulfurtransferase DndC [Microcoleus sp. FACHB-SPT15]|uniref:DNA phosphorothioation system sulfurtransferase DndC n=1 Tax=Microcoleus sp. FACHB-SPT15 TaxID=2692830 RepID=UPI00329AA5FE